MTETNIERFTQAHPEVAAWMHSAAPRFEFAASLLTQVARKGVLSERQLAAAMKCVAGRKAAQEREENAPTAEVARIEQGFANAKAAGLQRPKLCIGGLKFSPAGETSANPGAIYAKDRDSGAYLGKFASGRFVRSSQCTQEQQAMLLSIAADPFAAAVNHGRLTGGCAVCNRTLSDPESVERGIGPICAKKFGWL